MACDDRSMSSDERIVLRSSWPATLANGSPILVVLVGFQIIQQSIGGTVTVLVVVSATLALVRQLQSVELTREGLDIHLIGTRRVAWQDISSVEFVNRFGGHQLRIHDVARKRGRYLPAPRGAFGVGKQETAQARDLIEQWWQAYGNRPVPLVAKPTLPPVVPGGPDDPYRPPPEDY
jgi:hypothetical protein